MRRMNIVLVLLGCILFIGLPPIEAQEYTPNGVALTCDNGLEIHDAMEIAIPGMREGYPYKITVLGIAGFDPVVAVLPGDGSVVCNDDSPAAAQYSANLPTTNAISPSSSSAQVQFRQTSGENMADVLLYVAAGADTPNGEFLVLLEGMALTEADGIFDYFNVQVNRRMTASGIDLSVYLIGIDESFDPFIVVAGEGGDMATDAGGTPYVCDDAGSPQLCYGETESLRGSSVTVADGQVIEADLFDPTLSIYYAPTEVGDDPTYNYINYRFGSAYEDSFGRYLVAVHAAFGELVSQGIRAGDVTPTAVPTLTAAERPDNSDVLDGVSVDCPDGISIEGGVEIRNVFPAGTYRVTVVGVDDFDPVLAIVDEFDNTLCNDDSEQGAEYSALLPTIEADTSDASAQVVFTHEDSQPVDVQLIVGSSTGESGEFVVVIEGLATGILADVGNEFSVLLTPSMVASDVPLSVYLIAYDQGLDTMLRRVDEEGRTYRDDNNERVQCDDAGTDSCWGSSQPLENFAVTYHLSRSNQSLPAWQLDSMLTIPIAAVELSRDVTENYAYFEMDHYGETYGSYLLVLHVGLTYSGD